MASALQRLPGAQDGSAGYPAAVASAEASAWNAANAAAELRRTAWQTSANPYAARAQDELITIFHTYLTRLRVNLFYWVNYRGRVFVV